MTEESEELPIKLTWDGYYRFRVRYTHETTTERPLGAMYLPNELVSLGGGDDAPVGAELRELLSQKDAAFEALGIPKASFDPQFVIQTSELTYLDFSIPIDSTGAVVDASDRDTFRAEGVWAEVRVALGTTTSEQGTRVGAFARVNEVESGNMPSNWGMGTFAQGGDELWKLWRSPGRPDNRNAAANAFIDIWEVDDTPSVVDDLPAETTAKAAFPFPTSWAPASSNDAPLVSEGPSTTNYILQAIIRELGVRAAEWQPGSDVSADPGPDILWEGQGDDFGDTVDRVRWILMFPTSRRVVEHSQPANLPAAFDLAFADRQAPSQLALATAWHDLAGQARHTGVASEAFIAFNADLAATGFVPVPEADVGLAGTEPPVATPSDVRVSTTGPTSRPSGRPRGGMSKKTWAAIGAAAVLAAILGIALMSGGGNGTTPDQPAAATQQEPQAPPSTDEAALAQPDPKPGEEPNQDESVAGVDDPRDLQSDTPDVPEVDVNPPPTDEPGTSPDEADPSTGPEGAEVNGIALSTAGTCELSAPDGISVVDCPAELAVDMLTGTSPAPGVVALAITTETGLLEAGNATNHISMRFFPAGEGLIECFVRGTGEAMCREFGASLPGDAAPPQWDAATDTYTIDGISVEGGNLTWHGVAIAEADLFLRSRVDPNHTNTIPLLSEELAEVLDLRS